MRKESDPIEPNRTEADKIARREIAPVSWAWNHPPPKLLDNEPEYRWDDDRGSWLPKE
jgi:hypothetical protein